MLVRTSRATTNWCSARSHMSYSEARVGRGILRSGGLPELSLLQITRDGQQSSLLASKCVAACHLSDFRIEPQMTSSDLSSTNDRRSEQQQRHAGTLPPGIMLSSQAMLVAGFVGKVERSIGYRVVVEHVPMLAMCPWVGIW